MIREWLFGSDNETDTHYPWECSHCNKAMPNETKETLVIVGIFDYCPACGEQVDP